MTGKTNAGGGSASLNFKVIAYASEAALLAAKPAENTIGVVTTTPITARVFSASEPQSLLDGAAWFLTSTSSQVAFNVLKAKKDSVIIYPMSAKQSVGGVLVDVVAKSYIGGEWVDWWNGELYVSGDEYEAVTGGWSIMGVSAAAPSGAYLTKNADSMRVKGGGSGSLTGACTNNAIDISSFSELHVKYMNGSAATIVNIAADFPTSSIAASATLNRSNAKAEGVLDISGLGRGMYKINIADQGTLGNLYIYEVWLE